LIDVAHCTYRMVFSIFSRVIALRWPGDRLVSGIPSPERPGTSGFPPPTSQGGFRAFAGQRRGRLRRSPASGECRVPARVPGHITASGPEMLHDPAPDIPGFANVDRQARISAEGILLRWVRIA
jgi:hypothetical protein